jgi:hypothetical protein
VARTSWVLDLGADHMTYGVDATLSLAVGLIESPPRPWTLIPFSALIELPDLQEVERPRYALLACSRGHRRPLANSYSFPLKSVANQSYKKAATDGDPRDRSLRP